MNAKVSAILLTGLLLLMIVAAWAQTSDVANPTCPATPLEGNGSRRSSTWVRVDWNANTNRWDVDCASLSWEGNTNSAANATNATNATNAIMNVTTPAGRRRSPRGNTNWNSNKYINTDPYDSGYNSISNAANMAANAVNATRPARRRRP
jgi:hypothetical protein